MAHCCLLPGFGDLREHSSKGILSGGLRAWGRGFKSWPSWLGGGVFESPFVFLVRGARGTEAQAGVSRLAVSEMHFAALGPQEPRQPWIQVQMSLHLPSGVGGPWEGFCWARGMCRPLLPGGASELNQQPCTHARRVLLSQGLEPSRVGQEGSWPERQSSRGCRHRRAAQRRMHRELGTPMGGGPGGELRERGGEGKRVYWRKLLAEAGGWEGEPAMS